MKTGYYMVRYTTGIVPVYLTNINGQMYHYKSVSEEWELVESDRIIHSCNCLCNTTANLNKGS